MKKYGKTPEIIQHEQATTKMGAAVFFSINSRDTKFRQQKTNTGVVKKRAGMSKKRVQAAKKSREIDAQSTFSKALKQILNKE